MSITFSLQVVPERAWGGSFKKENLQSKGKTLPLECLQARPARARVILCMRHFLVASMLISGFCSDGPPFALPSLSPEAFYTRELFTPEPP